MSARNTEEHCQEPIEYIIEECSSCGGIGYWETTVSEQGAYGPTKRNVTYRTRCSACNGRGRKRVRKYETITERRERITPSVRKDEGAFVWENKKSEPAC